MTYDHQSVSEINTLRETIRDSEEKYRLLFEYTGTAMMVLEDDMTVSMGNHKTEEITGYTQEVFTQRRLWTEFVAEDDVVRMLDYFRRRSDPQAADGVPAEYQFRFKHKNGTLRNIHINVSMIPGTKQRLVSLQDVTDRLAAEQAGRETLRKLQESEKRFKDIAELLPGIICEIDDKLKISYVNQSGLTAFGFTAEDFKRGISVYDVLPADELLHLQRDVDNVRRGDFGTANEYRFKGKNNRTLYGIVNSAPRLNNGVFCGLRTCIIDITDLREAEAQLKTTEERLCDMFKRSPLGIALCDTQGRSIEINPSFGAMFASAESDKSINIFTLSAISRSQQEKLQNAQSVTVEAHHGKRFMEWLITPLTGSIKDTITLMAQVHDVTERRRMETDRLAAVEERVQSATQQIETLRRELLQKSTFQSMVSRSPAMKRIFEILPEIAPAEATVLIHGESGTGKELIARSLHELSNRKNGPLISINCGALPDTLLESELFGYKAGAFTDAKKDKIGKFAQAEGGTLFLDEIGDISPAMQVKLLRVLQQRTYEMLGDTRSQKADVRVVCATNKDLVAMVKDGRFREDLFYRIKILTVILPPLRDRRCDIPILCEHFIAHFNTRYKKTIRTIHNSALGLLLAHNFPGNIRELENIMEHAFIFCKSDSIQTEHLPVELRGTQPAAGMPLDDVTGLLAGINSFDDLERMFIKKILAECNDSRNDAAERLGVHRATLFRKMKQLGIE